MSSTPIQKSAKFKPVASNITIRKNALSALPSFSTPGFGKSKPITSKKEDVIDMSSDDLSNSASTSLPIKRTSSDFHLAHDIEKFAKRPKREDKENVVQLTSKDTCNILTAQLSGSSNLNHVPRLQKPMEIDDNPFSRLDKDFPIHARQTTVPVVNPVNYTDMTIHTKTTDELRQLLNVNMKYRNEAMTAYAQYQSGEDKNHDLFILGRYNDLLDKRLAEIRTELERRELQGQEHNHKIPPPLPYQRSRSPPVDNLLCDTSISVSSTSTHKPVQVCSSGDFSASMATGPTSTSLHRVEETTAKEPPGDDSSLFVSDSDDFWGDLGDIPIEALDDLVPASTDDITPTFNPADSPHYDEIMHVLKTRFSLTSFRKNQFEAINAAVSGRDVFVLMPTGGGKSLCFQLPALCTGGKTKGVTVVISPLLALMQDQVLTLKKKGVDVLCWNSESSKEAERDILSRLGSRQKPNIFYVTPEKLQHSGTLQSILSRLYGAKELARFVVDEAHCISTWGRDFREAYEALDLLRKKYPKVPITALTATANRDAVNDIKERLCIPDCVFLKQSFNRPNLTYSVVMKSRRSREEMVTWINSHHPGKSGVIYCFSRNECQDLAAHLRDEYNLKAKHYHAGMTPTDKSDAQRSWQRGECNIIVATIAFGMGIDKADVRFVIHYSLPKSLDGYYQETGRAGRDGKPADCILYFSHGDKMKFVEMVRNPRNDARPLSEDDKQRQVEEIFTVARFCLNEIDCRRVQLLRYYDEDFNPKDCHGRCDNCRNPEGSFVKEVTAQAKDAIKLVQWLAASGKVTKVYSVTVFEGKRLKAVKEKGHNSHPLFGSGQELPKGTAGRVFDNLLALDALCVYNVLNGQTKYSSEYIKLGPQADKFLDGKEKLYLKIRPDGSKKNATTVSIQQRPVRAQSKSKTPTITRNFEETIALYKEDAPSIEDFEDDDDQINDGFSPKPDSRRSAAIIDDIEPDAPSEEGRRYTALLELRKKFASCDGLEEDEIFDDSTLEMLVLLCPTDRVDFCKAFEGLDLQAVEDKWTKYGRKVLSICIQSKLGDSKLAKKLASTTKPNITVPFDKREMHDRFCFDATSSSSVGNRSPVVHTSAAPTSSTKRFNFRGNVV